MARKQVWIVIISVLVLLFCLLVYYMLYDKNRCKQGFGLSLEHQNQLYNIMLHVDDILVHHHIWYLVHGGTLLGCVRHKDRIPWDDDIDIIVLESDINKLMSEKIKQDFDKYGLEFKPYAFGLYRVTFKDHDFPFMDVFPMRPCIKDQEDGLEIASPVFRAEFPKEYVLFKDVYPIHRYQYGPLLVCGPHNPIPYLDRTYQDWATKIEYPIIRHGVKDNSVKIYDIIMDRLPNFPCLFACNRRVPLSDFTTYPKSQ